MNPALMLAAGAMRGISEGKRRKEQLAMQKAKIPLIKLQIEQQKLYNAVVQKYLDQQGYQTGAESQADVAPPVEDYKPVYQSTANIMKSLSQPMAGMQEPPMGRPGPGQPSQGGMDLMGSALIQSMSGGRLPLMDVAKEQNRQRQYQQTENRLSSQFERQQNVREQTLRPIEKEIDGKQYVQWVDYRGAEIGEPVLKTGKKGLSTSEASRLKLAEQGKAAMNNIIKAVINDDGSINRGILWSKTASKLWPGFEGASITQWIREALESRLRLVSGAAITETDISTAAKIFDPGPLDRDDVIKNKLYSLQRYLNGVTETVDPNKNYTRDDLIFTNKKGEKFVIRPQGQNGNVMRPQGQNNTQSFFNSVGINPPER